jgi:dipeptidyl aminopeptidase/acylaminoacyl peptidase
LDAKTGQYEQLPYNLGDGSKVGRGISKLHWISNSEIELGSYAKNGTGLDSKDVLFNRSKDGWAVSPATPKSGGIAIEVRQDLNTPPRIFAVDHTHGLEQLMWDPNPQLTTKFKLGHVEKIGGKLPLGNAWSGTLTYPADYVPGRKYPLVIQSIHGKEPDYTQFTLYDGFDKAGEGLGPSRVAVGARQLLAGRNIAVADVWVSSLGGPAGLPAEGPTRQALYEAVAKTLIDRGLVDSSKIGLSGYSRAGFHVEYTLTHSKFPFAAAVANDNVDYDYLQMALDNWPPYLTLQYGALPFGDGLKTWLRESPGFNADKIHTPLYMNEQSGNGAESAIAQWETFSRLRALKRPVEMYIMPDIELHPSHEVQNPRQLIAVQQRTVDWFDFWLNGHEEQEQGKHQQYRRWEGLCNMQIAEKTGQSTFCVPTKH